MENGADFKLMAKAYGRVAKAYAAQQDFEAAVRFYDKALTNHRINDYLTPKKVLSCIHSLICLHTRIRTT
jgi:hypothetical protein